MRCPEVPLLLLAALRASLIRSLDAAWIVSRHWYFAERVSNTHSLHDCVSRTSRYGAAMIAAWSSACKPQMVMVASQSSSSSVQAFLGWPWMCPRNTLSNVTIPSCVSRYSSLQLFHSFQIDAVVSLLNPMYRRVSSEILYSGISEKLSSKTLEVSEMVDGGLSSGKYEYSSSLERLGQRLCSFCMVSPRMRVPSSSNMDLSSASRMGLDGGIGILGLLFTKKWSFDRWSMCSTGHLNQQQSSSGRPNYKKYIYGSQ